MKHVLTILAPAFITRHEPTITDKLLKHNTILSSQKVEKNDSEDYYDCFIESVMGMELSEPLYSYMENICGVRKPAYYLAVGFAEKEMVDNKDDARHYKGYNEKITLHDIVGGTEPTIFRRKRFLSEIERVYVENLMIAGRSIFSIVEKDGVWDLVNRNYKVRSDAYMKQLEKILRSVFALSNVMKLTIKRHYNTSPAPVLVSDGVVNSYEVGKLLLVYGNIIDESTIERVTNVLQRKVEAGVVNQTNALDLLTRFIVTVTGNLTNVSSDELIGRQQKYSEMLFDDDVVPTGNHYQLSVVNRILNLYNPLTFHVTMNEIRQLDGKPSLDMDTTSYIHDELTKYMNENVNIDDTIDVLYKTLRGEK